MPYVIFSIDNANDTHAMAKFLRHIDTRLAMQEMRGTMAHCVGCYEGALEPSFILTRQDYDTHVAPYGFTDGQICILECPDDTRQPCFLEYGDGRRENVGQMQEVSAVEAMRRMNWTYRLDLNKYFATK